MDFISQYPGIAVIGRAKWFGLTEHIGVLLPSGRVAHCAPGRGEHLSTLAEFAAGQNVRLVRHVPAQEHQETVARISQALTAPRPYDVFTNNCEMFANRVTGEKPASPQLQGFVAVLAIVGLVSLAAR